MSRKILHTVVVMLLSTFSLGALALENATMAGGCTDAGACNYNPSATFNDGSCCYDNCVEIEISESDFPDEISFSLLDGAGNTVLTVGTGAASPSYSIVCLSAGCYQFIMNDAFGDGWNGATYYIGFVGGAEITSGTFDNLPAFEAYTSSDYFLIGPGVLGCTDAGACNFNPSATCNDGSCDFESCVGCTDATACNYNESASIDDGSCCSDGCIDLVMIDYVGDGWNNGIYEIRDINGDLVESGTMDGMSAYDEQGICLPDGCYTFEVMGSEYPEEIEWTLYGVQDGPLYGDGLTTTFVYFTVGESDCFGCTDPSACTYNPFAFIDDGSCISGPCVAYDNPWTARSISPANFSTCSSYTGTLNGATASQVGRTQGATGQDVWFRIVDNSGGIRFTVTSSVADLGLVMLDASYQKIKEVNLRNGTGSEALNIGGLTPGQVYYVGVRSINGGTGTFTACVSRLRASAGPNAPYTFTVCGTLKTQHTAANQYNFFFEDVETQQVLNYSIANATTIALTNVPGLEYGKQYNLSVGCTYFLANSLGVTETIVLPPTFTRLITIGDSPVAQITSSFSCSSYGAISPGTFISFNPRSCGITGYHVELVNQDGIQDTLNLYTVGASRYFRFSQVAGYIPGAQYNVRVRPYFPYAYDAPFGPSVCLRVAGTSSFFSITNNFGDDSEVELEKEPTFSASLYPNPNDGNQIAVLIDSEEEREFIITIYDGLGRLVHNEKVTVSGELNYDLNHSNTFADGVYTVNFYSNGDVQTQRMIVKNK